MSVAIYLQYKFKENEIDLYRVTIYSLEEAYLGSEYEKSESKLELSLQQRLKEKISEDTFRVEVNITGAKYWKDNIQASLPIIEKVYLFKMTSSGEMIDSGGLGVTTPSILPKEAIELNSQWGGKDKIQISGLSSPLSLTTSYTLEDIINQNGFKCAKIKVEIQTVNIQLPDNIKQSIGATGENYFAIAEGKLIKSTVKTFTNTFLPEGELKVTTFINLELEKNKEEEEASYYLTK